jgi:hypothetical protein
MLQPLDLLMVTSETVDTSKFEVLQVFNTATGFGVLCYHQANTNNTKKKGNTKIRNALFSGN